MSKSTLDFHSNDTLYSIIPNFPYDAFSCDVTGNNEETDEEVRAVEEELEKLGITSEYRVSLEWESTADLDIYVVNEDSNEMISYKKTISGDGNTKLDVDNRGGEQGLHLENISFNGDAGGNFVVYVNNHDSKSDTSEIPFTVVTKLGTQSEGFHSSWSINDMEDGEKAVGDMMRITTINF